MTVKLQFFNSKLIVTHSVTLLGQELLNTGVCVCLRLYNIRLLVAHI